MDKNKLFQISETAHTCGISRSTLMRLEEKGLIKPAYIDKENGYRYYDNHNIGHILQIEKFKTMGLDNKEIIEYFVGGGEIKGLLTAMEERLQELQNCVEELRIRSKKEKTISVSIIKQPAVLCMMKLCEGHTIADKYNFMYDFYTECIKKGCVLSGEPLFSMSKRDDYLKGYITDNSYPFYVCVPVKKTKEAKEAILLKEQKALSLIYYGSYDGNKEAWLALGKEVNERKLIPDGLPRALGIVAPYTGREIEEKRYCTRFILPIKTDIH